MSIAGDKIHRATPQSQIVQELTHRRPPFTSCSYESNMRSSEHTQREILALFADGQEICPDGVTPDNFKPAPIFRSL